LKKRIKHRNNLDSNTWLIINLIEETGCNPSELIQLAGEHINKGFLNIPENLTKNKSARSVKLTKRLLRILADTRGLLISGRQGAYSTRRIQQILKGEGLSARQLRKRFLRKNFKNSGLKHMKDHPKIVRIPKISGRDGLVLSIFHETGCKTGELCKLRVADVGSEIRFSHRKMHVSQLLQDGLNKACRGRNANEYLFNSSTGALSARRIQQIVKKHGITPRMIRKSFAMRMSKSKSCSQISKVMGVKKVTAFTHGII